MMKSQRVNEEIKAYDMFSAGIGTDNDMRRHTRTVKEAMTSARDMYCTMRDLMHDRPVGATG